MYPLKICNGLIFNLILTLITLFYFFQRNKITIKLVISNFVPKKKKIQLVPLIPAVLLISKRETTKFLKENDLKVKGMGAF
jgi:hypothetical protein